MSQIPVIVKKNHVSFVDKGLVFSSELLCQANYWLLELNVCNFLFINIQEVSVWANINSKECVLKLLKY